MNTTTSLDKLVTCDTIIGTKLNVYSAWEKVDGYIRSGTYRTIGGQNYIRIGTNPDSSLYSHLDGQERIEACYAAYEEKYAEAYALILSTYPDLVNQDFTETSGEIETISA